MTSADFSGHAIARHIKAKARSIETLANHIVLGGRSHANLEVDRDACMRTARLCMLLKHGLNEWYGLDTHCDDANAAMGVRAYAIISAAPMFYIDSPDRTEPANAVLAYRAVLALIKPRVVATPEAKRGILRTLNAISPGTEVSRLLRSGTIDQDVVALAMTQEELENIILIQHKIEELARYRV